MPNAKDTLPDFRQTGKSAQEKPFIRYSLPINEGIRTRYHPHQPFLMPPLNGKITKEQIISRRFNPFSGELDITVNNHEFTTDYQCALAKADNLIEGAYKLCETLLSKYRLYCITNRIATTRYNRFSGSELNDYFEDIFISEKTGDQKPDLDYFNIALPSISCFNPGKILIIGDLFTSERQSDNNTGIDTGKFNPPAKLVQPDITADNAIRQRNELLSPAQEQNRHQTVLFISPVSGNQQTRHRINQTMPALIENEKLLPTIFLQAYSLKIT